MLIIYGIMPPSVLKICKNPRIQCERWEIAGKITQISKRFEYYRCSMLSHFKHTQVKGDPAY